jgi:hypothetical protein
MPAFEHILRHWEKLEEEAKAGKLDRNPRIQS